MLAGCVIAVAGAGALGLDARQPDETRPAPAGALEVTVTDARQLGCGSEGSLWEIEADVVGRGLPSDALVEVASLGVSYLDGERERTTTVTPVDTDGFVVGASTTQTGTVRAHPILRTVIPCGAATARLGAVARVDGDQRVHRADDAFLIAGLPMSITTLGAIGLALLAAVGLVLGDRALRRAMAP